jgi:pyridinium-3,5-bisthiocarboxylic acid mononucleotide nickel chelatase
MRTLYIDCFSGVAGDMMLGALLDLGEREGLTLSALREALTSLDLPPWQIEVEERSKRGIRGLKVMISASGVEEPPPIPYDPTSSAPQGDRPQEGMIGDIESHDPSSNTSSDHRDAHEHEHGYTYRGIRHMLSDSTLDPDVKDRALSVFDALAMAEGKVHGCAPQEVHFHEVGMVDSVLDIVGSAWCLTQLKINRVHFAPPPVGRGWIRCAHGVMPLPAPATAHLLEGLEVIPSTLERELVTPTGAAMIKAWADEVTSTLPLGTLARVGWGAGGMDLPDRPNLIRGFIFECSEISSKTQLSPSQEMTCLLETNLDDCSAELIAHACALFLEAGAFDVWQSPITMKKGRSAISLSVLCRTQDQELFERLIFNHTSTLGIRSSYIGRRVLRRSMYHIPIGRGTVRVKVGWVGLSTDGAQISNIAPEYEDAARLAQQRSAPLKEIYEEVIAEARRLLLDPTARDSLERDSLKRDSLERDSLPQ